MEAMGLIPHQYQSLSSSVSCCRAIMATSTYMSSAMASSQSPDKSMIVVALSFVVPSIAISSLVAASGVRSLMAPPLDPDGTASP